MAVVLSVVLAAKAIASTPGQWTVNISAEGKLISTDVPLTNPINAEQEKNIKWYLETYTRSSPYSSTTSACGAIINYAKSICDQLLLASVVPREKNGEQVGTVSLEILDEFHEPQARSTIHQLHWELLEHPDVLGKGSPRILVRRSLPVAEPALKTLHHVTTWFNTDIGVNDINMLLVVARNLTANPATYNDISPWIAFDVLAGVKRHLASQGSPIRLNIQIVRPGTLKAFQTHLANSEEKYGEGYFHIVHFDLHGSVKKDNRGYLHFNEPNGNGTVEVPAVKVANYLRDYKVPWAVLNACESARTNAGNDANIAAIFRSRGVRNVLAMSCKFSASAAEIFLQALYTSLLTQGATFSVAAQNGRDALRLSSQRGARFRLTRDVLDWFVPVLYSSQEEAVTQSPLANSRPTEHLQPFDDATSLGIQLYGRDFDLLRFEKMLLQQKSIFLHGPSGGGKSAFLEYARELWMQTGFLDIIVYLDLKENKEAFTEKALEDIILKQLADRMDVSDARPISSWIKVVDILKDRPAVIIVDNMNAVLTVLGSHKARLRSPQAYDVLSVCQKLVDFASKNPCYVIFADCRERFMGPLQDKTGHKFEQDLNTYRIGGLELSAATDLAYSILTRAGVSTSEWKSQDHAQLQLILEALQCLPGTLDKVLPLAKTCDSPWSSFYTTLICNTHRIGKHIPVIESCAVWEVLDWARRVQPATIFHSLMVLGAYWYEAPDEDFMDIVELPKCIGSDKSSQRAAVVLAIDRGLIAETGEQVYWVHPLFTIFARTWEIWDRSTTALGKAVCGIANFGFSWGPPEYWFIRALCEPDMDRIQRNPKEREFLTAFMGSLEAQDSVRILVSGLIGADYQNMVLKYPTKLPNLLAIIRISRAAGRSLHVEQWPHQFLSISTTNIRMIGRVPEMTLFAQEYELLLNDVIDRIAPNGSRVIPLKHIVFILLIVNYLSSTYLSDIRHSQDRGEDFVNLALEIGEKSEPAGGYENPTIIYLRGLAFRYKYMLAIKQARRDNVEQTINSIERYWGLSEKNDKKYIEILDKTQKAGQPSVIEGVQIPDEIKALLPKVASQPVQRAYVESRKHHASFKKAIIHQLRSENPEAANEMMKPALISFSKGLNGVHTALEDFGYQNLREQTAWAPPNLNMNRYYATLSTEKSKLEKLATALDEGDIHRATEAQHSLAMNALQRKDFDEAMEHLDSLQELYAGNPHYYERLEGQNGQESRATAHRTFQAALDALSDGSIESAVDGLKYNERLIAGMESQRIPEMQDAIQVLAIGGQLWKRDLERNPSGLAASSRDLGIKTRESQRQVLELISENHSKPEEMHKILQMCLEIQNLFQKRAMAQDNDNEEEELKIITRQLQFTKTDIGKVMRNFLNPEELQRDLENIKLRRDWQRLVDESNFLGARVRLKLASERDSFKILEILWPATEKLQLGTELTKAEEEAKLHPPSVSRYEKLIDMHASGEFSHMDPKQLDSSMKVIRYNRSWTLSGVAFKNNDWKIAIACLDECLASGADDPQSNPRKHDKIIDMKESVNILMHTNELRGMDMTCDYQDGQRHIDALRALFEHRRNSPDVQRSLPSIDWTPELFDRAQSQLNSKLMIMQSMGPEMGKAFILASRQAPGSEWPY
ncbi:hypothetical protein K505DRAFT_375472 [Melanomma pulvis-pyrius CBS 109.77]|uniref:CHAT domain-containing protein n=1 Tax=Melanomma pulvis-pyrius CBS 109.77 TaxID=1314802 RepID=A0A6A6XA08_9PLEO|nr:hypothetical protein K505DRAFT_375472 [Melanomma pulvis-pyrius CBS 109.77]